MIYIQNEDKMWIEGEPTEEGQLYKKTFEGGGVLISHHHLPQTEPEAFRINNVQVSINGNQTTGLQSIYFGMKGDSLNITLDLVGDDNVKQTQIDQVALGYPPMLAMPFVKTGDGVIIDSEYIITSITAGTLTLTKSAITSSGNWVIEEARVNKSLAEINADWRIDMSDITFRIG